MQSLSDGWKCYLGARSASCIERPACTEHDYYPVLEPCHHGKTRNVYVKVSPSVCRDDTLGAVKVNGRVVMILHIIF